MMSGFVELSLLDLTFPAFLQGQEKRTVFHSFYMLKITLAKLFQARSLQMFCDFVLLHVH